MVALAAHSPVQPQAWQQATRHAQHRAASSQSKGYLGCAVYVSEARDAALLQRLEAAARAAPGACLANTFVDVPYNRSNFTLVGTSVPALAAAASSLAQAALAALDMRAHDATHPRLGVVDHISCHPLGPAAQPESSNAPAQAQQPAAAAGTADQPAASAVGERRQEAAVALATAIARQLAAGPSAVPVLTYGWAHPEGRRLDALRRELGYFRGAAAGSWQGGLQPLSQGSDATAARADAAAEGAAERAAAAEGAAALQHTGQRASVALPVAPCYGPMAAPARSGVCCVGATPWIVNYNVLLHTDDMAAARAVARAVSERGGGLPAVQAMALRHTHGIEVACNLLDPGVSPPEAVLARVQQLAAAAGVVVDAAYRTNKSPEELVAAAVAAGL